MRKTIFLITALLLAMPALAANYWVKDPTTCPVLYEGINCGALKVCGYVPPTQCYDNTLIAIPAVYDANYQSQVSTALAAGYVLDCYAADNPGSPPNPYCGLWKCDINTTCYSTQFRITNCTTTAIAHCGDCRTNYLNCTGDNVCEILVGEWCNITASGLNGTCTACGTTGKDAAGNDCNCVGEPVPFYTGILASYFTNKSLLWGAQYGPGWLINMTSYNTTARFGVNASGCIVFPDNTTQCTSGGAGGVWEDTGAQVKLIAGSTQLVNVTGGVFVNGTNPSMYMDGTTASGTYSTSIGLDTTASGAHSLAAGYSGTGNSASVTAAADSSLAVGYSTDSCAFGVPPCASKIQAIAGATGSIAAGYATTSGDSNGAKATISSEGLGAFAFGKALGVADSVAPSGSGLINASGDGALALGEADRGTIEATADGAIAYGDAVRNSDDGSATISATAIGATAEGYSYSNCGSNVGGPSCNAQILAAAEGSTAGGKAEIVKAGGTSIDAMITAEGEGAMAYGDLQLTASGTSALINASGDGSFAAGQVKGPGAAGHLSSIEATGSGSFAFGQTTLGTGPLADGSILSSGNGSIAMGISEGGVGAQSMWSTGKGSIAMGRSPRATADGAVALGFKTAASGDASLAVGSQATASGNYSTAIGLQADAIGYASTAFGSQTTAGGIASTAMGASTVAAGSASSALGNQTNASGTSSLAIGHSTKSTGSRSFAGGQDSEAIGLRSFAFGYASQAIETDSYAFNAGIANATLSLAFGPNCNVHRPATRAIAMGNFAEAENPYTFTWGSSGCGAATPCINNITNSFAIFGSLCVAPSNKSCPVAPPGEINANGSINANAFDLAERMPSDAIYDSGDVVVIDETIKQRVTISTQPYSTKVAGIISEDPGFVLGWKNPRVEETLVALAGRTPVKVTDENGPIKIGDLLTTSSTPGYAMRCDDRIKCIGAIVGKAMEPLEEKEGKIVALVTLQ